MCVPTGFKHRFIQKDIEEDTQDIYLYIYTHTHTHTHTNKNRRNNQTSILKYIYIWAAQQANSLYIYRPTYSLEFRSTSDEVKLVSTRSGKGACARLSALSNVPSGRQIIGSCRPVNRGGHSRATVPSVLYSPRNIGFFSLFFFSTV